MQPLQKTTRPSFLRRIGRFSVRYRWWVLCASLVFAGIAGLGSIGLTTRLDSGGFSVPGSESFSANTVLDEQFHVGDHNLVLLVTAKQGSINEPLLARAGRSLTQELATQTGVSGVVSYWTTDSPSTLRSRDGTQGLILAHVNGNTTQARDRIRELAPLFTREDTVMRVGVGGDDGVLQQSGSQSQRDLVLVDSLSLPILLIALFFVFRSPLAAILPLVMGGLSILGTLLGLRIIVSFTQISNFTLNLALGLGLGIGVDYGLFLIARYREELRDGKSVHEAIVRSVEAAGRMVLFSALTFGVSLAALLISPNFFLRSFSYAGIAVVCVGAASALFTLPALLAIVGPHINRWMVWQPEALAPEKGFWHRTALFVMRRPLLISVTTVTGLVLLGLPFLRINFGIVDDRILPPEATSRQVQTQIRSHFVEDVPHAIPIVTTDIAGREAVERYAMALSRIPGVVEVDAFTGCYANGRQIPSVGKLFPPFIGERGMWLSVIPSQERVAKDAYGLVRDIRSLPAPFIVLVGGHIAESLDLQSSVLSQAPIVIGLVILTTFLALFLMTASIVLPLKAIILNFLSLSVTFGAVVWIFQDGNLSSLLGFTATGGIEIRTVVLMFCIAFGLSMDYEVFLMGRIKEEYDRTGDTVLSVARGLEKSGPLVTAAAALLAIVFAAFAVSQVVLFKMLGIGMTLAILIDATIIRALLIPAFMRLLGGANWWAPAALKRLQQRIGFEDGDIPLPHKDSQGMPHL